MAELYLRGLSYQAYVDPDDKFLLIRGLVTGPNEVSPDVGFRCADS